MKKKEYLQLSIDNFIKMFPSLLHTIPCFIDKTDDNYIVRVELKKGFVNRVEIGYLEDNWEIN